MHDILIALALFFLKWMVAPVALIIGCAIAYYFLRACWMAYTLSKMMGWRRPSWRRI